MQRISWLISCGLAVMAVMLLQYFYQMKSETGNLGIVGIALAVPFILLCLFITYNYFRSVGKSTAEPMMVFLYTIFGIAFITACMYFANDFKQDTFLELGGDTNTVGSKVYGLATLNAETSKIYFNFYTIAALITVISVISTWIGLCTRQKAE